MYDLRKVNVAGLRSVIQNFSNNFSYNSLDNTWNNLTSNDSWGNCNAKLTFFNGLKVNKSSMDDFKKLLNDALDICNKIEKWQNIYSEMLDHSMNAETAKRKMTYTVTEIHNQGTPEETKEQKTYTNYNQKRIYDEEMAKIQSLRDEQFVIENNVKNSLPLWSLK